MAKYHTDSRDDVLSHAGQDINKEHLPFKFTVVPLQPQVCYVLRVCMVSNQPLIPYVLL